MTRIDRTHGVSATGFTLAETLVTLVIFSLVLVVMTNGLRTGAAVWAKVEHKMGQAEQVALTEQLLSGLFDRAYAANTVPDFVDVVPGTNTSDRFSFVYYAPPWPDEAGYVLVELRVVDGAAGKRLELDYYRRPRDEKKGAGQISKRTSVLIDGADHLAFSYLMRDRRTGLTAWQDSWSDADVLPPMVQLRVEQDGRVVEPGFEIENALAPDCMIRGTEFNCEARQ